MGKIYQYRIRRIDVGKYQVEEQYTVLFVFKRWRVGSRRLGIGRRERFASSAKAAKAIQDLAAERGLAVHVTDLEAVFLGLKREIKDQGRGARKKARAEAERARNLRRIGKEG